MINERDEACWNALVLRGESGKLRVVICLEPENDDGQWLVSEFDDQEARDTLLALDAARFGGGVA